VDLLGSLMESIDKSDVVGQTITGWACRKMNINIDELICCGKKSRSRLAINKCLLQVRLIESSVYPMRVS